jgi:hypothetical protein
VLGGVEPGIWCRRLEGTSFYWLAALVAELGRGRQLDAAFTARCEVTSTLQDPALASSNLLNVHEFLDERLELLVVEPELEQSSRARM